MTPRMYFALVLRGIGAWKLVHSLEDFTTAWNIHEKLYTLPYDTSTSFINLGVVNILVGAFYSLAHLQLLHLSSQASTSKRPAAMMQPMSNQSFEADGFAAAQFQR
jgi:hypothetical protein